MIYLNKLLLGIILKERLINNNMRHWGKYEIITITSIIILIIFFLFNESNIDNSFSINGNKISEILNDYCLQLKREGFSGNTVKISIILIMH